jgi:ubiquinone/menaquinone biosynthesis C-methylase UbiE
MTDPKPQPGPMQNPTNWDIVAPTYAEDVAQWKTYAEDAVRIVRLAPSDRVLDVACGPGTITFLAAPQVSSVSAVDFSPGMIEQLKERAAREGIRNIEAAVMDAQALEFPDSTFDAAFCLFAFFFFPDRARAFRELHRVLRPGGRALIATWGPIERRPLMQLSFEALAEALPHLPRPAKGDLQVPEECIQEMSAAGFADVTAQVVTASVRFESAKHYTDLMVRSSAPFAAMKQRLSAEEWNAAEARFHEAVQKRMPADGAELSAEAILTSGQR